MNGALVWVILSIILISNKDVLAVWPWQSPRDVHLAFYLPPWTGIIDQPQDNFACGAAFIETTRNLAVFLTSHSCRKFWLPGKNVDLGLVDGGNADGIISLVIKQVQVVNCFQHDTAPDDLLVFTAELTRDDLNIINGSPRIHTATLANKKMWSGKPKKDTTGFSASMTTAVKINGLQVQELKVIHSKNCDNLNDKFPLDGTFCAKPVSGKIPMGMPIAFKEGKDKFLVHGIHADATDGTFIRVDLCSDKIQKAMEEVKKM